MRLHQLSPSAKQCQNHWSRSPLVYRDLSMHHDWPLKKAIVDLPIRLKGNLSLLGAQDEDISAALQT